jgi:hypothetical protein
LLVFLKKGKRLPYHAVLKFYSIFFKRLNGLLVNSPFNCKNLLCNALISIYNRVHVTPLRRRGTIRLRQLILIFIPSRCLLKHLKRLRCRSLKATVNSKIDVCPYLKIYRSRAEARQLRRPPSPLSRPAKRFLSTKLHSLTKNLNACFARQSGVVLINFKLKDYMSAASDFQSAR